MPESKISQRVSRLEETVQRLVSILDDAAEVDAAPAAKPAGKGKGA